MSVKARFSLFIIILLGFSQLLSGQSCNLILKGQVLSAHTHEPLSFANVAIKGKNTGAIADENGEFIISDLCAGTYTVVCTRVGCDHKEHQIHLADDTVFNIFLEEHSVMIEEVVVETERVAPVETQATEILRGAELESGKGLSLGESISRLPGVTTLNTGATIAKPVIQGLHSNRVLILNNGVRLEGQQWGLEHPRKSTLFLPNRSKWSRGRVASATAPMPWEESSW